jgi:hypothetical protein
MFKKELPMGNRSMIFRAIAPRYTLRYMNPNILSSAFFEVDKIFGSKKRSKKILDKIFGI